VAQFPALLPPSQRSIPAAEARVGGSRSGASRGRRACEFEFYFSRWWITLRKDESPQPWKKKPPRGVGEILLGVGVNPAQFRAET